MMKRFWALIVSLMLAVCLAVPGMALENKETVIDLGVEDLGNGFTCHTTLTVDPSFARASGKSGVTTQDYFWWGTWVGTVQLNGSFTYNGSTATATGVSASHSVASGWSYGGESTWCSGNSVYLSAAFSGPGGSVPVSMSLSCSGNGTLS